MKLEHIEIQTADLGNTTEFYQNPLNFPVTEKTSDSISVQIGRSTLKLGEDKSFDSVYHLAFNIPENKLAEALNWCKKKKLRLIPASDGGFIEEFGSWHAHSVYFYDNNGNILEFIARHDLRNSQHSSFESNRILNISEIGIVKDHPLEFGEELSEKYGFDFFAKHCSSEIFTVLGDDEGLLVIVKTQRHWHLTDIPAKSNKTKIKILNKGRITQIKIDA